jgi:hypothetical protein
MLEGGFTDDDYFSENVGILDKGMIFNKLALDFKASKKMKVGASVIYMMTAEDIEYTNPETGKSYSDDQLGLEFDTYLKYKIYDNLEFAVNAGYMFTGDAMDFFERDSRDSATDYDSMDGDADENIFISTCRVRYKF